MLPEEEERHVPDKLNLAYAGKIGGGIIIVLSLLAFATDHESRHTKVEVILERVDTNVQMITDHLLVTPASKVVVKEEVD